ncbi:histidinol-phosphatase [Pseudogemmobacter faecipullorum]|uniref:Histidinol-phosphatase n=1 Tax=Pseudogemmobacter faecipullorum TaxID=2755041 RepID=A0ABS8CM24_9RHOB|nr:histidinol-phosphatase [Pseudogemmobacter faecipullorum]MCB5410446.1 histidinol-phosphatase [Pseudogemmobacter faecipullorum]
MPRDSSLSLTEEIGFLALAAEAAKEITLSWFRQPIEIEDKEDHSPVTIADRATEAELRRLIASHFPADGILGEEEAPSNPESRRIWVVDPIDGTRSFITGHPLYGCLIALLQDGIPLLGQIDMPVLGERWQGRKGAPSTLNGAACRTRKCQRLSDAWIYTTSPQAFPGRSLAAFEALSARGRLTRYGGDCYNYGLLASGHCDLVAETGLQPFDYLPLVPVIEGAGGVITDWQGQSLSLHSAGDVIAAATPELHAEALSLLRGQAPGPAG